MLAALMLAAPACGRWARVAGIACQILDERQQREGKGVPIYRPKYLYVPLKSKL